MSLEDVIKPFRNPKVVGGILFGSIGLSLLFAWGDIAINEEYIRQGGSTNAPISNYQKWTYIRDQKAKSFDAIPYNKK